MKSLKEALLEHPPQMLRGIAELNALALPEGGGREQWAAFLAAELGRAEVVQRAWQSLDAATRAVVDTIIAGGGKIKAFQMLREHGEIRPFGPLALARDKPWLAPANVTERLWYLGLIQRSFDVTGGYRGEMFFIPEPILQYLPKTAGESAGFVVKAVAAPDVFSDHADALLWDTFILMAWVAREEPPLTERGTLSPADLYRLHAQLTAPDAIGDGGITGAPRLSFLIRLGRAARLIKQVTDVGLRLGPLAKEWLKSKHQERRLQLLEAWRSERGWNELRAMPSLKVEETGWRNDPRLARETTLKYLAQCPSSQWLSLASFVANIKRLDPDFQRPDGDYDRWHIRDAQNDKLLMGFAHWNQIEGAQLAFMLEGPLAWLGVVRVGGATKETRAFQLTEFGARALGLTQDDLPEPAPQKFIVQGDFDVLAPREAPLVARFQLERMADRVQWDNVSTYHLTRDSVTRLLRRNATIGQIIAILKNNARAPFPNNVEFTLREWAAKYGEITLRRAAILHTRDRHLLNELRRNPELSKFIIEVISPTVALVAPERLAELHKRLQVLGYSPRLEEQS